MGYFDNGSDISALKKISFVSSSLPWKAALQILAALDINSFSYRQEKYLNHPKGNEKASEGPGSQDLKPLEGKV